MTGVAKLVDAMLVIAVGLLVFLVISWNMQAIVFNDSVTPEQKQDAINARTSYRDRPRVRAEPDT